MPLPSIYATDGSTGFCTVDRGLTWNQYAPISVVARNGDLRGGTWVAAGPVLYRSTTALTIPPVASAAPTGGTRIGHILPSKWTPGRLHVVTESGGVASQLWRRDSDLGAWTLVYTFDLGPGFNAESGCVDIVETADSTGFSWVGNKGNNPYRWWQTADGFASKTVLSPKTILPLSQFPLSDSNPFTWGGGAYRVVSNRGVLAAGGVYGTHWEYPEYETEVVPEFTSNPSVDGAETTVIEYTLDSPNANNLCWEFRGGGPNGDAIGDYLVPSSNACVLFRTYINGALAAGPTLLCRSFVLPLICMPSAVGPGDVVRFTIQAAGTPSSTWVHGHVLEDFGNYNNVRDLPARLPSAEVPVDLLDGDQYYAFALEVAAGGLLVGGQAGKLYRSSPVGATESLVHDFASGAPFRDVLEDPRDGTLWAGPGSYGGAWISADGGASWLPRPLSGVLGGFVDRFGWSSDTPALGSYSGFDL